jgi:23S rRNA pseudouridine1911/1915/1917 synthase
VAAKLEILHEDNHVLVVSKPAGILSQADLSGDLDLLTLAKESLKRRDKKSGNVYLGLVHRLDRPVAGVMVIAKTSKAASRLSRQFREHSARKIYRAVVEGVLSPAKATLTHRLQKDRSGRITRVVASHEPGKEAMLHYAVLESKRDASLVEVELVTGLPHQIRVQLSSTGHPIIGDVKYGAKRDFGKGRIALYARALTFEHPVKKEPMTVEGYPPAGWPWD